MTRSGKNWEWARWKRTKILNGCRGEYKQVVNHELSENDRIGLEYSKWGDLSTMLGMGQSSQAKIVSLALKTGKNDNSDLVQDCFPTGNNKSVCKCHQDNPETKVQGNTLAVSLSVFLSQGYIKFW